MRTLTETDVVNQFNVHGVLLGKIAVKDAAGLMMLKVDELLGFLNRDGYCLVDDPVVIEVRVPATLKEAAERFEAAYKILTSTVHEGRPDDKWDRWAALDWACVNEFTELVEDIAKTGVVPAFE
jgi:hypothetical protein